jgi:hypothetical protein
MVPLPQVHDTRKQGLVTYLIQTARQKGVSAYVGDGANRWAAAPLQDVALLYRFALEKGSSGMSIYHAVQEEGVPLRDIASTIAKGLGIPSVSLPSEGAVEHFGPFVGHFVAADIRASSDRTRKALDWNPIGPGLVEGFLRRNTEPLDAVLYGGNKDNAAAWKMLHSDFRVAAEATQQALQIRLQLPATAGTTAATWCNCCHIITTVSPTTMTVVA